MEGRWMATSCTHVVHMSLHCGCACIRDELSTPKQKHHLQHVCTFVDTWTVVYSWNLVTIANHLFKIKWEHFDWSLLCQLSCCLGVQLACRRASCFCICSGYLHPFLWPKHRDIHLHCHLHNSLCINSFWDYTREKRAPINALTQLMYVHYGHFHLLYMC